MLLGHQIARNPETKKTQKNQGIIGAGLTFEEKTQIQKEAHSNRKELTKKKT